MDLQRVVANEFENVPFLNSMDVAAVTVVPARSLRSIA